MTTFGAYIIGDEILSGKRQDAHLSKVIELLSSTRIAAQLGKLFGGYSRADYNIA